MFGILNTGFNAAGPAHPFVPEPYRDAAVIRFANGFSIDTRMEPLPSDTDTLSQGSYWLAHLSGPARPAWLGRLSRAGAEPVGYIAFQTVVCRAMRAIPSANLARLDFVDWFGRYPAHSKLAPELVAADRPAEVVVALWPGEDAGRVAQSAGRFASIVSVSSRTLLLRLDADQLIDVAALEPVTWVQTRDSFVSFNSDVQWVMQNGWSPRTPDTTLGRPIWQHGIRGQNMVVGLFDSGINTNHDMFIDPEFPLTGPGIFPLHRKIAAYKMLPGAWFGDVGSTSYHGSAVAGTLCGNDSIAGDPTRLEGVAPDCRVYFVDNAADAYIYSSDLTELLDSVRLGNGMPAPVRQVSGSFGSSAALGYYQLEEATLDAVCWQDPHFLVIWAAGNSGQGTYNIGHPGCAKSCITIGATGNGTASNTVSPSSSGGPTRDERIRPTLVAPGADIATVDGGTLHGHSSRSGTSYSAPATNGALLLLRQYFSEGWFPSGRPEPGQQRDELSSALMRGLAVSACDTNVGTEYVPARVSGWGRLNLSSLMHFAGDSIELMIIDDTVGLAAGEYAEYRFDVDRRLPLTAVLAWTDTAAAPAAAVALVNDLNLELVSPDLNSYRGNQLVEGQSRPNPPNWDDRNVEEVCRLYYPFPGRWTARVHARNVFTQRQPYALIVKIAPVRMPAAVEDPANASMVCRTSVVTHWPFHLGMAEAVTLTIIGADGRCRLTNRRTTYWDGRDQDGRRVSSGVYFYQLAEPGPSPISGRLVVAR